MRTQVLDASAERVGKLVEAGIARGELLPSASAEIINDLLFGSLFSLEGLSGYAQ